MDDHEHKLVGVVGRRGLTTVVVFVVMFAVALLLTTTRTSVGVARTLSTSTTLRKANWLGSRHLEK